MQVVRASHEPWSLTVTRDHTPGSLQIKDMFKAAELIEVSQDMNVQAQNIALLEGLGSLKRANEIEGKRVSQSQSSRLADVRAQV